MDNSDKLEPYPRQEKQTISKELEEELDMKQP